MDLKCCFQELYFFVYAQSISGNKSLRKCTIGGIGDPRLTEREKGPFTRLRWIKSKHESIYSFLNALWWSLETLHRSVLYNRLHINSIIRNSSERKGFKRSSWTPLPHLHIVPFFCRTQEIFCKRDANLFLSKF